MYITMYFILIIFVLGSNTILNNAYCSICYHSHWQSFVFKKIYFRKINISSNSNFCRAPVDVFHLASYYITVSINRFSFSIFERFFLSMALINDFQKWKLLLILTNSFILLLLWNNENILKTIGKFYFKIFFLLFSGTLFPKLKGTLYCSYLL